MFDEENAPEGYKCECGGSIMLYDGVWYCDECNFEAAANIYSAVKCQKLIEE